MMQLPHWLIIGGSALVAAGSIGLALRKTKAVERDLDEPVKPREPMPPLPTILNSDRKRREEKTELPP
jgi:hypothetical protein